MKNAHLRFGSLVYTRVTKNSSTQIRMVLDRFIGEPLGDARSVRAHLISILGNDTAVAALHAAIMSGDRFSVEGPEGSRMAASLGLRVQCYRGTLPLRDVRSPLRHLIAVSEEPARIGTRNRGEQRERAILLSGADDFVWRSLAEIHGLPGSPQWAGWIVSELRRRKRMVSLTGIGCDPVLVNAGRDWLLAAISRGLRRGALNFPAGNGPISWPEFPLLALFEPSF